ncbi:MAG: SURF1 family cytochrome oxidase biogenesis protein [Pseudomonadota bacterium]
MAIAAAFSVLMWLGTWQVQRLHWKEALIAAANERPSLAPVAAPGLDEWPDLSMEDWEYRPVTLRGAFGEGEALYFIQLTDPRGPVGGTGYFVLSPFVTERGWTVMVNRGFVPEAMLDPAARPAEMAPPVGEIEVTGIVRPDDPANVLQPLPEPGAYTFLSRDIAGMAAAAGAEGVIAPYQVDLFADHTPAGGQPQAGEWRISFTNNHLAYAITWYGIGAGLVLVVVLAALRGPGGSMGSKS